MIEQFKLWQLRDNPFLPLPPQNEATRHRVFVGRTGELNSILSRTNRAQGMFILGMFGIGKSMLALEALRQLRRTHKTVYVKFKRNMGLVKSILLEIDDVAVSNYADPLKKLQKSLAQFNLRRPMIAVIDDLDKDTDIGDMQKIIIEARQVIELGCLIILLGHPVGVTAELSSAHDILYPIPLSNLGKNELAAMIGNYLSISRKAHYTGDPLVPFSQDIAEMLSGIVSDYKLTPRILNHACRLLLDQAAHDKILLIDTQYFGTRWPFIAKSCLESLHQEDREYFRKIHEAGRLSEDTRVLIRDIGGEFAEYAEIRKTVGRLIQEDILIEKNVAGKREITPNALFTDEIIRIFR